ncbi:microtubule-associated tumor suppressor 1 homolog [Corythoichthys intestinalis]|uniref:microtubule-associated tumor suppressor 1 homolog n=1 Tax=Corythoichthys intestinalis TaxID=161448 RepID=UPI0025A61233|nr:microtubule-associated tumor suppressor 1 homolog [Corythoichthys intestinalis]XP_057698867.1 microtubule-associated tumor suppressor 1 homolog [Corythoichthys intestinalis]XP_057698868.1 microtubule-associated tumor suppressor 1 homolog [Corythoichthys intestinalis]XP_057698869.1 microtubule-associated tumor suppressor 1 homolog [Corythoichthys intestinalis]XP_057698871.1 microtubule-associated tumor suppressor 1 homolog [Corythoichthys intestinalis]
MSVSKPIESIARKGKSDTSIRLCLHTTGDHNGNACPTSSSSSSPSLCFGESSLESLCSRNSISSGCIDSPQDYDMFEITVAASLLTGTKQIVEDAISNWQQEGKKKLDKNKDAGIERIQTEYELSESNDNSVSVYLDASAGGHQETRNDNDDLALSLSLICDTVDHVNNSNNRSKNRHGSSTPDSEATEILPDDDTVDDEALYFSISSDVDLRRTSATYTNSSNPSLFSSDSSSPMPDQLRVTQIMSDESSEGVLEELQMTCHRDPHCKSEDISDTTHRLSVTPSVINLVQDTKDIAHLLNCTEKFVVVPTRSSRLKLKPDVTVPLAEVPKMSLKEENKIYKVDLKNIKAKVGSRPAQSAPKQTGQSISVSEIGRKVAPRKEEAKGFYESQRPRPSVGTVKVALVLKPIRGQSTLTKSNQNAAACDSKKSKRQTVAFSGTPSRCTSNLHKEKTKDQHWVSPRKVVQEITDKCLIKLDSKHLSAIPCEECLEDYWEGSDEALLTLANMDKPRNHTQKVSKLGPTVRPPRKKGLVPPPGTGPPGPESLRHRQSHTNGPNLKEVSQSAGDGSPLRVKHLQNQSHGVSKPHTVLEQTASPTAPGSSNFNSKSTVSHQPASGLCGRPVLNPASKLPVKGLSSNLIFNENSGPTSRGSLKSSCSGIKSDERASKNPSLGSQSGKTLAGPASSFETVSYFNSPCLTDVPKSPVIRSKAASLQSRSTNTGLKAPSVSNHNLAKIATANQIPKIPSTVTQVLTKQAPHSLQRRGSARLNGLNGTVDKNKPRDVHARSANNRSSSPAPALAAGNKQQNPSRAQAPNGVYASAPVTTVPAVPVSVSTNSGTIGPPAPTLKGKTSTRSSPKHGTRLQSAPKPGVVAAKHNQGKEPAEKKNQASQLWKLLSQANKKVEVLATVIQHLFNEREKALKQKNDLSLELAKLKDELVASSQCCDRLHKEKEEAHISSEETLKGLDKQHKEELVQLEERLRNFYQTEWDKVHQAYQEEADKCRMLMEQQVEEMRTREEAERKNQEASHNQLVESLKEQHETSLQELKRIQEIDLQNLDKTLKETETTLSEKISELTGENAALNEKLKAEEERRQLSDKNLKDSHTLYLEQELESLKVVLEMKNNQLHQKEKKLMELDKMVETNVKLEECLKKVQQENEDYKARMDKHAALSRQLSSEQAILQQTLQKESKVNKRLSMENEELLWKLHNGDLMGSPRRLSPTSPFGSPRNSASFPAAAPLSPR